MTDTTLLSTIATPGRRIDRNRDSLFDRAQTVPGSRGTGFCSHDGDSGARTVFGIGYLLVFNNRLYSS